MRLRVVVRLAALLFATSSPLLLRAQFQEPTKEELQMTAAPKAPGADAVYLYREETTDDALHYHGYYQRAKILTEKGKELATIRILYEVGQFKVSDIRGRTIHADGTVIPLTATPADLVDVKTKNYQVNTMVFALPSAESGQHTGIPPATPLRRQLRLLTNLGCTAALLRPQGPLLLQTIQWARHHQQPRRIARQAHVRRARGKDAQVVRDASGRYTFDASDIPAVPSGDWMPPLNSINWRVEFYYSRYSTGGDFWKTEGKRWAKETERFANPNKTIQQAVAQVVAAGDSDEQKARKLYDAVMKLDNTTFSCEKSSAERKKEKLKEIKDAEGVWKEQSGSADDMALLYIALARAAGLQAFPMQVVNRSRAIFDPTYLSTSQLDDYVAIVVINGKELYLDPGQKMCPFALLHWKHALAGGLRLTSSGPVNGMSAGLTYQQAVVQRVADLTIDADNNVKGTLRFAMSGQEALYWRQLAMRNDPEEVKKQFNESLRDYIPDGVQADFDHFLALDDYSTNLLGFVRVTGSVGTATGKLLRARPLF
jgi:hypothetical protein